LLSKHSKKDYGLWIGMQESDEKTAAVGVIDKLNFKVSTTSLASFRCSCLRRGGCVISKCSPFTRGLDLFTKFVCWPKRWIYSNIFSKAGEISCQGVIAWIKLWYLILPSSRVLKINPLCERNRLHRTSLHPNFRYLLKKFKELQG